MRRVIPIWCCYDLDKTLCPASELQMLKYFQIDQESFWEEVNGLEREGFIRPMGWLYVLANMENITKDALVEFGRTISFFPGVVSSESRLTVFDNLRQEAARIAVEQDVQIELRFALISLGIGDVIRASAISTSVDEVYATEVEFSEHGRITWPKHPMLSVAKTRALFQIQKGISFREGILDPDRVNRLRTEAVPMTNICYVGDGYSDVECWSVLAKNGAKHLIAVYDPDEEQGRTTAQKFYDGRRVQQIHPADYSKGSLLYNALVEAISETVRFSLSKRSR